MTMSDEVEQRIALVTGANRGIGREVCRQLAKHGLKVVLTARQAAAAASAAAELQNEGLDVVSATLDVADRDSIRACVRDVTTRVGGVDVLVNNAAVLLAEHQGILDTPSDVFRQTFETNVWGALMVCEAFTPSMI